ncbi:aminotransferase class V-fold PLP-dependent enzyme [Kitasatospora sp. LaBMicrA B282]|uniref:aminotransferase class V-fold PLP-dependent enzyme n=1 Tax=Kitasatospora sp. LaBMicrA B282 TaxID=3420949 RepID=UPI003D0B1350
MTDDLFSAVAPTPPAPVPPAPIPGAAELFALDPAVAHLNHGSFGAVPLPVSAAQDVIRAEQEADPDGFFHNLPARVAAARAQWAPLLGAEPEGFALVDNVTEAVAIALDSVPLRAGDEILVTDHGYGVVNRAAERRAAECGATVRVVALPLTAPDAAPYVLEAVTGRTRVAVLDRITSPTAREVATPELVRALAERGVVTLVDAAHAPGMLAGELAESPADFWFGNLHKWAFAPRPAAVLAVAPAWRERVRPLTYSWEHPRGFPYHVEWRGTVDYTGWAALPAAVRVLEQLGPDRMRAHNTALAAYGAHLLTERTGLAPLPASERLSMRAVRLPVGLAEDEEGVRTVMAAVRERLGTRVAVRPWAGGGVLRISAQVYNRPEEYEKLAAGLGDLLASLTR